MNRVDDRYIDIHSHVLWGMDDGSRDIEETVALCEMAEDTGTEQLILTPHLIYWENVEALYDSRERRFDVLSDILDEEGFDLKIHKGFEILCDDDIFNIKHFRPYTLCNSRYILIEFDFFKTNADDVISWCDYLISFGLVPIIAHPERYSFFYLEESAIDKLSSMGVLFQINSGSAAGMFGSEAQHFAEKMIYKNFADFIGSDAHDFNMRNTDIDFCFGQYSDEINVLLLGKTWKNNALQLIDDKQIKVGRLGYFAER